MGALTQVANEGYAEKERKHKERNNPNPSTTGLNKSQAAAYSYFEDGAPTLGSLAGGMVGMGIDANGNAVINENGIYSGEPVAGYQIGSYITNDVGETIFVAAPGKEQINVGDNQEEFLRKAGIK
jgi:hypothetical protein